MRKCLSVGRGNKGFWIVYQAYYWEDVLNRHPQTSLKMAIYGCLNIYGHFGYKQRKNKYLRIESDRLLTIYG